MLKRTASRAAVVAAMGGLVIAAPPAKAGENVDYSGISRLPGKICNGIETGGTQPSSTDIPFDGGKWRIVAPARAAYYVNNESGGDPTTQEQAADLLKSFDSDPAARSKYPTSVKILHEFEAQLAAADLDGLRAFGSDNMPVDPDQLDRNASWLMAPSITLRCLLPEPKDPSVAKSGQKEPSIRLRGNVDALAAEDKARKSADAASFGYSRTRTFEADGSRSQATEISVNAVLGAVFAQDLGNLTAFAGYELKQNRRKPAPALTPPATVRDGDTEIVTLGVIGKTILPLNRDEDDYTDTLGLTYSGSYLFDRVKDSERVKGQIGVHYYHGKRVLGLCKIGALTDLDGKHWLACQVDGIATYNQVTRHGSLVAAGDDHFGHAGVKFSGAIYIGDPTKGSSLFASGEYQFLWRYDGDPAFIPNINRHAFTIGHRWWHDNKFAIEINAKLIDGINPDSFANENNFSLGFGIIF